MSWELEFTDQFEEWWETLTVDQREAVYERVKLLEVHGPDLGRPVVDRIEGSRHPNMKELRVSAAGAHDRHLCEINYEEE